MSINLTDEIEVKTKKGKLGAAKQIFLEGDTQTVEKEIQDINSRHNTLNTKHESLSRTVQGISVTGGASTANNVTYNNDSSGLNAENAQDAIDVLSKRGYNFKGIAIPTTIPNVDELEKAFYFANTIGEYVNFYSSSNVSITINAGFYILIKESYSNYWELKKVVSIYQTSGDLENALISQRGITNMITDVERKIDDYSTIVPKSELDYNSVILDTSARTLTIKAGTGITIRKTGSIVRSNSDIVVTAPENFNSFYLIFNYNDKTCKLLTNLNTLDTLKEDEVLIGLIRFNSCILVMRGLSKYTLNGKKIDLINSECVYPQISSIGVFGGSLSVFENSNAAKEIWKRVLRIDNIKDYGVPGAGFSSEQGTSVQTQVMSAGIHDVYILWASTNDYINHKPCGTWTDYTEYDNFDESKLNTQCGGINFAIRQLLKINSLAKIYFFLPIRFFSKKEGHDPFSSETNGTGKTFYEYIQEQIKCCEHYGIPYLDQFSKCGFNEFNYTNYYVADKLHLTRKGYEKIGYMQAYFLANN